MIIVFRKYCNFFSKKSLWNSNFFAEFVTRNLYHFFFYLEEIFAYLLFQIIKLWKRLVWHTFCLQIQQPNISIRKTARDQV